MNDLIRLGTSELANFLNERLPDLTPDWWQKHVVARLSFQQQRMVQERGYKSLAQLDFAGLLRVFDQNWYEFSNALNLPHEGRTWIKELQSVRNKWAHLSAEAMPPSETYRDADTLSRLLTMIGASQISIDAVEESKTAALNLMACRVVSGTATEQKNVQPSRSEPDVVPPKQTQCPIKPTSLFRVGDLVALRSNPTLPFPVLEVMTGGAECRYRVFQNNAKTTYYESQLQTVAAADDRKTLTAVELQARLTSLQISSPSTANLFSLRSGRVQFVPYQYRPVLKLIRSDRPRLLIADEVGVGKTIEAGLIIKELRARTNLNSVLIICPKALVAERKWYLEMKRFDESFTALNGQLLRHCLKETHLEGEWPEQYAKAIVPFSLFDSELVFGGQDRSNKNQFALEKLSPPPKFDLVIVDEAHHIRNSDTYLHQGVRHFCENAEAVLFLTATPVQLGSGDLFTLLNVLRPDLVIDHASFQQMAEPNPHINAAVQQCRLAKEGWQQEALNCMGKVVETEWGRLFLRESPSFQQVYDRLRGDPLPVAERVGLIRTIEELYTFSSLINRTRRRDIGEFTTRKPETLTIEFTPNQKRLHDDLLDVVARILTFCHGHQNVKFMMTTIRRQAASCLYGLAPLLQNMLNGKVDQMEFQETSDSDDEINLDFVDKVRLDIGSLIEQTRTLDMLDPKVEAFVKVLTDKGKLANNKALVFSTFRHTLAYLAQNMLRTELRFGLIHGDVPDEERANLRRRFALPKENTDAIDVLLSSEVGCEGLDFQFCDFLINYDLPWNPMRIEQRIGRIDRYGQKSPTVAIVNIITPGTVDADIYERCLLRIGVFQHAIGGNEEILGEVTKELHDIAESFTLTPIELEQRLQQLADNGIRRIQEDRDLESKQAELFGLNVPNPTWQQEIQEAESFWLSTSALQRCVSTYLAVRLEASSEPFLGGKSLQTLRLNQEARIKLLEDYKQLARSNDPVAREWEKWLKGGQPTLSVTFDQETATENRHAVHLSVIHPLVRQAAHYLQLAEPAYVALSAQSEELSPGTYHFALYRWRKCGVKPDEVIVPVSSDSTMESKLLELLHSATEADITMLPSQDVFDQLDAQHHAKWNSAQANHIAENREQVEYRIQSLTASHRGRCKALADKIFDATNDKIILMRQSELARAEADFTHHMSELTKAANSGDIHASPVIFGTLDIVRSAI